MGHSTFSRLLELPLGVVALLLYMFVLTGVPNVEDLSRRARFAAACRRSPWLTGIASLFFSQVASFAPSSTSCDSFLFDARPSGGEIPAVDHWLDLARFEVV